MVSIANLVSRTVRKRSLYRCSSLRPIRIIDLSFHITHLSYYAQYFASACIPVLILRFSVRFRKAVFLFGVTIQVLAYRSYARD